MKMFQIHLMNILSPFVESLGLYKCESEISDLGSNDSNQDYLSIVIHK